MSYKNDSLLVIKNKYGSTQSDVKAMMFETYDKLRDLTVNGSSMGGTGFGTFSSWLNNIARFVAPASFMPVLGNQSFNIPGTSNFSSATGANSAVPGGKAAVGFGGLGNMPGFPSGYASGIGMDSPSAFGIGGTPTGFAAADVAAQVSGPLDFSGASMGMASGFTGIGSNWVLPAAGIISGLGGLAQAIAPYSGSMGVAANVFGNVAQGYGGSILAAYETATQRIVNNADTILTNKVTNLEAVSKMLGAQSDVIKKMLKDEMEAASKIAQDL